jgi:hypothetical protein
VLWWLVLTAMALLCSCQPEGAASPEATPSLAFKGYELYSWPAAGEWHFALLPGTNRIKTFEEITSPSVRLDGIDALQEELAGLARGEQVFWVVTRVPHMALPPDAVIDEIGLHCRRIGVQLTIER